MNTVKLVCKTFIKESSIDYDILCHINGAQRKDRSILSSKFKYLYELQKKLQQQQLYLK
jgi:hypothetical protein